MINNVSYLQSIMLHMKFIKTKFVEFRLELTLTIVYAVLIGLCIVLFF